MKRVFPLLVAGIFLALFIFSSNEAWMKAWAQYRYSEASALPSDRYRYGDLYGFSYLHDFKIKAFSGKELIPKLVPNKEESNIHLYSLCDSYLWSFLESDSLLRHADAYSRVRWSYGKKQFQLDSSKRNILLIERVERYVRESFADTAEACNTLEFRPDAGVEVAEAASASTWWESHVFNKKIEENLEFNLFDYTCFTPLKEFKAALNYSVFGRSNRDVFVSKAKSRLYYMPTVDSTSANSAFRYLSDKEVDALVVSLNRIRKHYRRAGIDEVYLAIMPNPVTVLEPELGKYNGLIPRLQNHPKLEVPIINVHAKLRQLRNRPIYERSDTHWSIKGFLAGLAQIDSMLATQAQRNVSVALPQRIQK